MKTVVPDPVDNQPPQSVVERDFYRRFSKRGLCYQRFKRLVHGVIWSVLLPLIGSAKRVLDVMVAVLLFCVFLPFLAVMWIVLCPRGESLQRQPKIGRWGERFDEYALNLPSSGLGRLCRALGFGRLPVLVNIIRGDMSFIGPRAVVPGDLSERDIAVRKRHHIRPGLICLWWLRSRANIAYESELDLDCEYVDTESVWQDLGIALRAIPALIYGDAMPSVSEHLTILGIPIDNLTMTEAVDAIIRRLDSQQSHSLCFVNADCANLAYCNPEYHAVLNTSDLTLADGIGLKLAGRILSTGIKQNVNGTDLFPRLCEALADTGKGLFILGARPGIPERVRDWIAEFHPQVTISGWHHGYYDPDEEEEIIHNIASSGASLLLVAFGAPRQELWIAEHLNETGVKVAIGVGGLFDFYSGRISRAPLWMREMGLEWLYRFWQEPGRMWKRYFVGNSVFLSRVIWEKYTRSGLETRHRHSRGNTSL